MQLYEKKTGDKLGVDDANGAVSLAAFIHIILCLDRYGFVLYEDLFRSQP